MKNSLVSAACMLAVCVAPAFPELLVVDLGKNLEQTQLNAAGDLTSATAYFAARAFYANAGDFDGSTLTYPGPDSPATMTNVPGTYSFLNGATAAGYFITQSASFANQAAMDAAYPFGSYEYDLTSGGSTTATSTIGYTANFYPENNPVLSAASFNALAGLNPSLASTVNFNTPSNNPGASEEFEFLDVFCESGSCAGTDAYSTFNDESVSNATDFVIPANTLLPNTTYDLVLDFDNRTDSVDGNGVSQFQLFDTKTDVDFTTGAVATTPEPASFALLGAGGLFLTFLVRRHRRAPRTTPA